MSINETSKTRCPDCNHFLTVTRSVHYAAKKYHCHNRNCPIIRCWVNNHPREAPSIYRVSREAVARAKPLNGLTIEFIKKHPEVLDSE